MTFKEEILSQVNVILQSVKSIVRQMSNYQEDCQCPNYSNDFWWDHENVNNTQTLKLSASVNIPAAASIYLK